MSFADQLVVLREGRLVQAGRPRDVYASPVDLATALFLGPSIILDGDIRDGLAHSTLGVLPLREDQRLPAGPSKVMLRPEQISLVTAAHDPATTAWVVAAIVQTGSFVRITLEASEGTGTRPSVTFIAMARDIPPPRSRVNVIVLGAAHRLAG